MDFWWNITLLIDLITIRQNNTMVNSYFFFSATTRATTALMDVQLMSYRTHMRLSGCCVVWRRTDAYVKLWRWDVVIIICHCLFTDLLSPISHQQPSAWNMNSILDYVSYTPVVSAGPRLINSRTTSSPKLTILTGYRMTVSFIILSNVESEPFNTSDPFLVTLWYLLQCCKLDFSQAWKTKSSWWVPSHWHWCIILIHHVVANQLVLGLVGDMC